MPKPAIPVARTLLGFLLTVAALLMTAPAKSHAQAAATRPARNTLVIGIDVSGSFRSGGRHEDAVRFAAHYLYAHLHGLGGLKVPTSVFVGSVGGDRPEEAKSFQPIHTFQSMNVDEITAYFRKHYPARDGLTDFNPFFARVATHIKRQGLVLAPLNVVVFTDGLPDLSGGSRSGDLYAKIDVGPLEYLSKNVTIRLLYPTPTIAVTWEKKVRRRRVRMWTVDNEVMETWRRQLRPGVPLDKQTDLWRWIQDNIDFRVRGE